MLKKYYLAYGSNLNLEQMINHCSSAKVIGSLKLLDYRLVYKGKKDLYAYLTIEKSLGDMVPLGLYEVSLFDIWNLDYYEGFPDLYYKKYLPITVNGENKEGLIYIMNEKYNYHIPSTTYIEMCQNGYHDFNFDLDTLDKALNITYTSLKRTRTK